MTDQFTTWQQCCEYTFQTRHAWRHGNGARTSRFNTNHFTRLRGSSFPVRKLTQPVLNQVCIELEEEGKSDATINRVISAVSTVLNHCAFDGCIESAPKFRRRKENEHRYTFYTKEQVDHMICLSTSVFERQDLADLITVASYSGMRQGELLKLRNKDCDFASDRLLIGGEKAFTTKSGEFRPIPMHDRFRKILSDRCSQSSSQVRVLGDEWSNKDQVLRAFNKVKKLAGFDETYVFHSLRHSFATWHADAGTPIRTLMSLMGHRNIETTLRYAKTTDKALTAAQEQI